MRVCPQCGFRGEEGVCPRDGFPTVKGDLLGARPADEMPSLVGRLFGERYQVEEEVGSGGMGWVFRAKHTVMNQTIALKVMRPDVVRDQSSVQRFFREARTCSKLLHPNTIKVHDFGVSDDGYAFLVMEFLRGRSLSQVLDDEVLLSPKRVVRIATQVCKSLSEAHDIGLVHRDLKPGNIFLADIPDHLTDDGMQSWASGVPQPEVGAGGRRHSHDGGKETPAADGRFKVGDRVVHAVFGEGVVITSHIADADQEVEVAFPNLGVKRLSVAFAPLQAK